MTRFARAKGSKSSNERLPEEATPWGELRDQVIGKKHEKDNKIAQEKAFEQRTANYKAFLKEKEEEEAKNISWADFPDDGMTKTLNTHKKRKQSLSESEGIHKKKLKKTNTQILDNQIDVKKNKKSTQKPFLNDSDSDAPPEEASAKAKPKEIVVKKAKTKKSLLKIVQDRQERHDNLLQNAENSEKIEEKSDKKVKKLKNKNKNKLESEYKETKVKPLEDVSETSLIKIEKKKERYQKQLEKKKLKRQQKKLNKKLNTNQEESSKNTAEVNIKKQKKKDPVVPEYNNENLTEKQLLQIQKKKERRARQAEKRRKIRELNQQEKPQNENEKNINTKKVDEKNLTDEERVKIDKKKKKLAKQAEKRKKMKEAKQKKLLENDDTMENLENNNITQNNSNFKQIKLKLPSADINKTKKVEFKTNPTQKKLKNKNEKDHKRKKPLPKPETMFINGKQIEIDYVDGFPVKKEDADRLRQLRKDMMSKGLPRSEIDVALKLERRRAEKALAREKKNVCFNCRKSGHNLSDCPELGNSKQMVQSAGTGICFKCGSTEHTHFECKVEKSDVYKFASCFICNEQGHIAKQCPDNQRGLYPKGGSCKVCGDVTHLKKDCPKYQAQQQHLQSSVSIGTLNDSNPDMMDGINNKSNKKYGNAGVGHSKIVKF